MHWTISVGTLLHLLFYAHIIIINFVLCAITQQQQQQQQQNLDDSENIMMKIGDYNAFESKYFAENDSYNNDKRQIIEDFYRQSALSVKSIKDISFHINSSATSVVGDTESFDASSSSTSEGNNN